MTSFVCYLSFLPVVYSFPRALWKTTIFDRILRVVNGKNTPWRKFSLQRTKTLHVFSNWTWMDALLFNTLVFTKLTRQIDEVLDWPTLTPIWHIPSFFLFGFDASYFSAMNFDLWNFQKEFSIHFEWNWIMSHFLPVKDFLDWFLNMSLLSLERLTV